jgi:hypothetical protein
VPEVANAEIEDAVPISSLTRHPENPRQGDVGAISESLEAHGFYGTVVAQRSTRRILAGNHRVAAAEAVGLAAVPVAWLDVDDEEALRILLADNRMNDIASYDTGGLVDLLTHLSEETEAGLAGTGYDGSDRDDLLADLARPGFRYAAKEWEPPTGDPVTQPGDVWQLGRHRLICGDATDPAGRDLAANGATVTGILTDPPYGMDLDTRFDIMHFQGHRYSQVAGDDRPFDPAPFIAAYPQAAEQFWFGADYYRASLPPGGSWFVWDKRAVGESGDVVGHGRGSDFELAWSLTPHRRQVLRFLWSGTLGMPSEDTRTRLHPTQKPTTLLRHILEQFMPSGAVICDPFAGVGSTLIACHQTGRQAVTIELDPAFCDATAERYQLLTGLLPERNGDPSDLIAASETDTTDATPPG